MADQRANGAKGPPDMRNATLLTDWERRKFIASLPQGPAQNSYSVLYKKWGQWARHARMMQEKHKGKPEEKAWAQLEAGFESLIGWLDDNLVLSGSINGKRAAQIVEAVTKEAGHRAGADVVLAMTGAPAQGQPAGEPADKKGFWRRG